MACAKVGSGKTRILMTAGVRRILSKARRAQKGMMDTVTKESTADGGSAKPIGKRESNGKPLLVHGGSERSSGQHVSSVSTKWSTIETAKLQTCSLCWAPQPVAK